MRLMSLLQALRRALSVAAILWIGILDAVGMRIEREDSDLYPLYEALAVAERMKPLPQLPSARACGVTGRGW